MKSGLWSELSVPAERRGWTIENAVRAMAGIVVLVSVGLAVYVSMNWLWLAVFVAVNLIQSSFTGWCLMSNLLAIASTPCEAVNMPAVDPTPALPPLKDLLFVCDEIGRGA